MNVCTPGKEEQKGKKKERQSLYTLTPDHPPLRADYVINNVVKVVEVFKAFKVVKNSCKVYNL